MGHQELSGFVIGIDVLWNLIPVLHAPDLVSDGFTLVLHLFCDFRRELGEGVKRGVPQDALGTYVNGARQSIREMQFDDRLDHPAFRQRVTLRLSALLNELVAA